MSSTLIPRGRRFLIIEDLSYNIYYSDLRCKSHECRGINDNDIYAFRRKYNHKSEIYINAVLGKNKIKFDINLYNQILNV